MLLSLYAFSFLFQGDRGWGLVRRLALPLYHRGQARHPGGRRRPGLSGKELDPGGFSVEAFTAGPCCTSNAGAGNATKALIMAKTMAHFIANLLWICFHLFL